MHLLHSGLISIGTTHAESMELFKITRNSQRVRHLLVQVFLKACEHTANFFRFTKVR